MQPYNYKCRDICNGLQWGERCDMSLSVFVWECLLINVCLQFKHSCMCAHCMHNVVRHKMFCNSCHFFDQYALKLPHSGITVQWPLGTQWFPQVRWFMIHHPQSVLPWQLILPFIHLVVAHVHHGPLHIMRRIRSWWWSEVCSVCV